MIFLSQNCRDFTAGAKCESCVPGYTLDLSSGGCVPQHGSGEEPCHCDPRGSLSASCPAEGRCQCKENVEGRNCNQCKPGTFNLHSMNSQGCLSCFCSGVTDQCTEATLYWSTLRVPIYDERHGFGLTDKRQGVDKSSQLQLGSSLLTYQYSPQDRRVFYWQLPRQFLGNKLAAYGGNMTIFQQFSTISQDGVTLKDSDVIMIGNGLALHYTLLGERIPGYEERNKVPVYEDGWVIMRGNIKIPATREDFLRVLSSIDSILVRATVARDMESSSISRVNMDIAVAQQTGGPPAVGAEECQCPAGYKGRSCEDCSPGYYRRDSQCLACPCSGNSRHCSLDQRTGTVVCECREGWTGESCQSRGEWWGLSLPWGRSVLTLHASPHSRWAHHGAQPGHCLCCSGGQGHFHLQLHLQSET